MNLQECTAHCRTMLSQHNGGSPLITEEEEVLESQRYTPGGSTSRTFKKMDVWAGPYGEQQIQAILVVDSNGSNLSAAMWGGSFSMTPTASPGEIGLVLADKMGSFRAVIATAFDHSWKKVDSPHSSWGRQGLSSSSSNTTSVDKQQQKEDTEGDRMMKFFASSQHDPGNPWFGGTKKERK